MSIELVEEVDEELFLVMVETIWPLKTLVSFNLWLWRSFVKASENNSDDVIGVISACDWRWHVYNRESARERFL